MLVERDLSVPGHPHVFVVGDMAAFTHDGQHVPGVAPAANQMGNLAAHNIRRDLAAQPRAHFRYRDKGNLATIGRHRAIAVIGRLELTGHIAWWFWLFIHILYLAGFRNRASVLVEWAYAYFTYQRGARLLSEAEAGGQPPVASASRPQAALADGWPGSVPPTTDARKSTTG